MDETMRPWVLRDIFEKLALASHISRSQHLVRSMLSVGPHHGRRSSGSGLDGEAYQKLSAIYAVVVSPGGHSRIIGQVKVHTVCGM